MKIYAYERFRNPAALGGQLVKQGKSAIGSVHSSYITITIINIKKPPPPPQGRRVQENRKTNISRARSLPAKRVSLQEFKITIKGMGPLDDNRTKTFQSLLPSATVFESKENKDEDINDGDDLPEFIYNHTYSFLFNNKKDYDSAITILHSSPYLQKRTIAYKHETKRNPMTPNHGVPQNEHVTKFFPFFSQVAATMRFCFPSTITQMFIQSLPSTFP